MIKSLIFLLSINLSLLCQDVEVPCAVAVQIGLPVWSGTVRQHDHKTVFLAREDLIGAIKRDNTDVLEALIPISGVNFLFDQELGKKRRFSPLSYAAFLGKIGCMRTLRSNGAKIDYIYEASHAADMRYSDLMLACEAAKKDSVEFLLRDGADIYMEGVGNSTVLNYAVRSGDLDFLKYIVSKFQVPMDDSKEDTRVALKKYLDSALLEAIDILSDECRAHTDMAYFLTECGARITSKQAYEFVFEFAPGHCPSMLKFILDQKAYNINANLYKGGLHVCEIVFKGCKRIALDKLIEGGLDIRRKVNNASGDTLLHLVIRNKYNLTWIPVLLELGLDINAKNDLDKPALDVAIYPSYKPEGVKALLQHGADISGYKDVLFGFVARHSNCDKNLLELLIRRGFDVSAKLSNGLRPLDLVRRCMECDPDRCFECAKLYEIVEIIRSHLPQSGISKVCVVQ